MFALCSPEPASDGTIPQPKLLQGHTSQHTEPLILQNVVQIPYILQNPQTGCLKGSDQLFRIGQLCS